MAVFRKASTLRRLVLTCLFAAVVALTASTAAATVMKYADLARMVEISDVIVRGQVVDQHTYFDDEYGAVVTDTTLKVEDTLYGKQRDTVTFQQWGGEYGGKMAHIPGDAVFEPYEEVVIFLREGTGKDAGMLFLSALGQSKYKLVRRGDAVMAVRNLEELAFLVDGPDGAHVEPRPAEVGEYASFLAELRTLIAGIKGGQ